MGALDEMLAKWRENPDAGTTLALCTYLGTSRKEDLIREVGSTAEAWHKDDPQVMLAIGRMYLDAALLQEAQAALVAAGKLNQSDSTAYRYLGEVLLRRGDAARAEKVLARALQIGMAEADTRMWHDRAVVYVALQSRIGMRAVADEIARTVPKKNSIPPPTISIEEASRLAAPAPAPARAPSRAASPRSLPPIPPPPRLGSFTAAATASDDRRSPGQSVVPSRSSSSEGEIPTGHVSTWLEPRTRGALSPRTRHDTVAAEGATRDEEGSASAQGRAAFARSPCAGRATSLLEMLCREHRASRRPCRACRDLR